MEEKIVKWFMVSMMVSRGLTVARRINRRSHSGNSRVKDLFGVHPRGRGVGNNLPVLVRLKNGAFTLAMTETHLMSFVHTEILSGSSAEEVKETTFEKLLKSFRKNKGWTGHRVTVRPISDGEIDTMAWTLLGPDLSKCKSA